MKQQHESVSCRSVFQGGENQTTQELTHQVTIAWIALINRLEQSKGLTPL